MVDWTLAGRTVELVLTPGTVRYLVTSSVAGNTEHTSCWRGRTLELILQTLETLVVLTVAIVPGISALVPVVEN